MPPRYEVEIPTELEAQFFQWVADHEGSKILKAPKPNPPIESPNDQPDYTLLAQQELQELLNADETSENAALINRGYIRLALDALSYRTYMRKVPINEIERVLTTEKMQDIKQVIWTVFAHSLVPDEQDAEMYYPNTNVFRPLKISPDAILVLIRYYGLKTGEVTLLKDLIPGIKGQKITDKLHFAQSRLHRNISTQSLNWYGSEDIELDDTPILTFDIRSISMEEFLDRKARKETNDRLHGMIDQLGLRNTVANRLHSALYNYTGSFEELLELLSDPQNVKSYRQIGVKISDEIVNAVKAFKENQ